MNNVIVIYNYKHNIKINKFQSQLLKIYKIKFLNKI